VRLRSLVVLEVSAGVRAASWCATTKIRPLFLWIAPHRTLHFTSRWAAVRVCHGQEEGQVGAGEPQDQVQSAAGPTARSLARSLPSSPPPPSLPQIDRNVKEKRRKERKEQRRSGSKLNKSKDPGIPNSLPFKNEVLAEIEHAKARLEAQKAAQKEKRRLEMNKRRGIVEPGGDDAEELARLASKAQEDRAQFEAREEPSSADATAGQTDDSKEKGGVRQSRRAYMKDLRSVIDKSDVLLWVLDARDPAGGRSAAVEEAVLSRPDKRLVVVLNKVDLAPKHATAAWLQALRRSFPTVAFKASTQEGSGARQQVRGDASKAADEALSGSGSVGAEALLSLLKNYCRSRDIKTAITVGVIGYPNVGKSSLINSLKRGKSVGVSSTPGFTKSMQEVHLDKSIRLLDCPGIVFEDGDEGANSDVFLKNCINMEALEDPTPAIDSIIRRCTPQQLMQLYEVQRFEDAQAFLALIARKKGKLFKGGIPDRVAAGKAVLRDWNTGRIPYFTMPPASDAPELVGSAQVLSSFSAEFKVDEQDDDKLLEAAGAADEASAEDWMRIE
jgi:nuclear GTP-binding protein